MTIEIRDYAAKVDIVGIINRPFGDSLDIGKMSLQNGILTVVSSEGTLVSIYNTKICGVTEK
jgi:hypothetical protein